MAVVPIKAGTQAKPPEVDPDLVSFLETLLGHAKAGEVRGFCCGFVMGEEGDNWFMVDEGHLPFLSFLTRKAVEALESDD